MPTTAVDKSDFYFSIWFVCFHSALQPVQPTARFRLQLHAALTGPMVPFAGELLHVTQDFAYRSSGIGLLDLKSGLRATTLRTIRESQLHRGDHHCSAARCKGTVFI